MQNPLSSKTIKKKIIEFKNDASTHEIIASFIQFFVDKNGIKSDQINRAYECGSYLNHQNSNLYDRINASFSDISLKAMESVFENQIDLDRKRSEGAVYTPDYIIDVIIKYSLKLYSGKKPPSLCDPSCGSGGFLVRAIDILANRLNLDAKTIFTKYIHGIDINRQAVSCAKIITELYFLCKGIEPPDTDKHIICADTLTSAKKELTSQVGRPADGFDLVVTNPPYVKLQNIDSDYRAKLIKRYPHYVKGSFSLAMLFLIAGHNLLSSEGVLGFITQNNLYTSLAGENVRKFVTANKSLHTIIDFGYKKIFSNASAYTCLIYLTNNNNRDILYHSCSEPKKSLASLNNKSFTSIPVSTLDSKKWRLAPLKHLENLKVLETNGIPLGRLAEIKVGFATLKDSVFLIDRNNGLPDIESDITRPAIKVASLKVQKSISVNTSCVIHPYKKLGGRWLPLEPDEFWTKYPKTYRYLEDNKAILLKRDKGKKQYRYFYEWGRTQGMDAPGPKLLTKTFSKGPSFFLDESDSLFCNGYSVKIRVQSGLFSSIIPLVLLQKILNSIVMDYYTKLTSFQIEGNYQCFQKNFIENFCIPPLTETDLGKLHESKGKQRDKLISEIFDLRYEDLLEVTMR